jgi:hypothetical protein
MMLQYPFIELFVRSRDIDMMIHAIKLLNNNALKSSVESRKDIICVQRQLYIVVLSSLSVQRDNYTLLFSFGLVAMISI